MFSVAYVFRRADGMTREQFFEHYEHVHGPLASKLPGLISYTQHPVRPDAPLLWHAEDTGTFDAISIYTFESDEAAQMAFASKVNRDLQDDSLKCLQFEGMVSMPVCVRHVV